MEIEFQMIFFKMYTFKYINFCCYSHCRSLTKIKRTKHFTDINILILKFFRYCLKTKFFFFKLQGLMESSLKVTKLCSFLPNQISFSLLSFSVKIWLIIN